MNTRRLPVAICWVSTLAGTLGFAPLVVAVLGCSPSPADDADQTDVGSTAADPSRSTSSATSTGTQLGSSGTPSSSTGETGETPVCPGGDGSLVAVTVSAPEAKMPGFGTYFAAACDVTSADAGTAALLCDGDVGEVTISVEGIEGLDLAGLPEQVVLDVGQTSVFESSGSKHSISTREGVMLFSYVGVGALEVLDDPWPSILPVELEWALRDCPTTSPQTGVTCSPAMLVIETPSGTSEAPVGEVSAISGGWQAFVSALAECVAEVNPYGDEVRFAIVSDTLL